MHSRRFRSHSDRLIERARRRGNARDAELFGELSETHEHAVCYRRASRPAERIREFHSSDVIEGVSIRSGGPNEDVITIHSLVDDFPLLPTLNPDSEIIFEGDDAVGLPSDLEIQALLTDLVHGFMQEGVRSVSAHVRMSHRRTLVIAEDRCVRSLGPAAMLRVDIELSDHSAGTAVGEVLDDRHLLDLNRGLKLARQATDRAQHRSGSTRPPSGEMPVVLMDRSSGMWVHEAIGHMLEADVVSAGPFSEMMGSPIAPAFVNVVDEPMSIGFDDEGTAAKCTSLINEGILECVLTDRRSANYGAAPSGNGRRQDYRRAPQPRQWGVRMLPGKASSEDLLAGSSGVAVVSSRRARVLPEGSFVLDDAIGFLVEGSRLTRPISGFSVIGDARQSLQEIELVGNNVPVAAPASCVKNDQAVDVHIGSPDIRFRRLTVRPN